MFCLFPSPLNIPSAKRGKKWFQANKSGADALGFKKEKKKNIRDFLPEQDKTYLRAKKDSSEKKNPPLFLKHNR